MARVFAPSSAGPHHKRGAIDAQTAAHGTSVLTGVPLMKTLLLLLPGVGVLVIVRPGALRAAINDKASASSMLAA